MKLNNHYFILRHGKTTWPYAEISYPPDSKKSVDLSPEGISQIEIMASNLKRENIDLIFCSEYLRVRRTAEIVAQALNLKPIIDIRLNDTELGDYFGKPKTDFYKDFSDPSQRFEVRPKNGESWNDVKNRQAEFLEEIEEKYDQKIILIVGHGDSLWLFEGLINQMTNKELLSVVFEKKEFIKKGELKRIN